MSQVLEPDLLFLQSPTRGLQQRISGDHIGFGGMPLVDRDLDFFAAHRFAARNILVGLQEVEILDSATLRDQVQLQGRLQPDFSAVLEQFTIVGELLPRAGGSEVQMFRLPLTELFGYCLNSVLLSATMGCGFARKTASEPDLFSGVGALGLDGE